MATQSEAVLPHCCDGLPSCRGKLSEKIFHGILLFGKNIFVYLRKSIRAAHHASKKKMKTCTFPDFFPHDLQHKSRVGSLFFKRVTA